MYKVTCMQMYLFICMIKVYYRKVKNHGFIDTILIRSTVQNSYNVLILFVLRNTKINFKNHLQLSCSGEFLGGGPPFCDKQDLQKRNVKSYFFVIYRSNILSGITRIYFHKSVPPPKKNLKNLGVSGVPLAPASRRSPDARP